MKRTFKTSINNFKKDFRNLTLKPINKKKMFKSSFKLMLIVKNSSRKTSKIFKLIAEKFWIKTRVLQKLWFKAKKVKRSLPRNKNLNILDRDKDHLLDQKSDKIKIISTPH